jgi:hypothetical protein
MRLNTVLAGSLLLAAGAACAQEVEIKAELLGQLGTNISRSGDPVSARDSSFQGPSKSCNLKDLPGPQGLEPRTSSTPSRLRVSSK